MPCSKVSGVGLATGSVRGEMVAVGVVVGVDGLDGIVGVIGVGRSAAADPGLATLERHQLRSAV